MYPRNTANIEQQLGTNQDSVEQLEVAELRRQVAEAKARKEAREKFFFTRVAATIRRSDSLDVMPSKNGSPTSNAPRVPSVEQRAPYTRDHRYQEEKVVREHLR